MCFELFNNISIMLYVAVLIINFLLVKTIGNDDFGYCSAINRNCDNHENVKYIFYDVNPPEGFNLRRDVYMRFAIMIAEAKKRQKVTEWRLVLPPWYHLYHWHQDTVSPISWNTFFDIDSLKSYTLVNELYELFSTSEPLNIDRIYVLENFPDIFEDGEFKEKWEIVDKECNYDGEYWGYKNITAREIQCVKFQGRISTLWDLVLLNPTDSKIMFAHGEVALHDAYGNKEYWKCRKSMKFNKNLIKRAQHYIKTELSCTKTKCDNYIAVHWRRRDFLRSHFKGVPSIAGTAKQIIKAVEHNSNIKNVFIATDTSTDELNKLEKLLTNYKLYYFIPTDSEIREYKEGGIAIIEQIICTYANYFIGTHESTFTFRIQEEREIMGHPSRTTFNRFCPDSGPCEDPSKWKIVH